MPRPSKYKAEYAEKLVDHMKEGRSFESFGAIVHCTEETLNLWTTKHPEFKIAKELGKRYEMFFWEELLKKGAHGELPPIKKRITVLGKDKQVKQMTVIDEPGKFNATAVIFALKNKFPKQWRERQELEISSKESLENLSDEEIKRRKELYASIVKGKNVDK